MQKFYSFIILYTIIYVSSQTLFILIGSLDRGIVILINLCAHLFSLKSYICACGKFFIAIFIIISTLDSLERYFPSNQALLYKRSENGNARSNGQANQIGPLSSREYAWEAIWIEPQNIIIIINIKFVVALSFSFIGNSKQKTTTNDIFMTLHCKLCCKLDISNYEYIFKLTFSHGSLCIKQAIVI